MTMKLKRIFLTLLFPDADAEYNDGTKDPERYRGLMDREAECSRDGAEDGFQLHDDQRLTPLKQHSTHLIRLHRAYRSEV